jgi:hypothetical protein
MSKKIKAEIPFIVNVDLHQLYKKLQWLNARNTNKN